MVLGGMKSGITDVTAQRRYGWHLWDRVYESLFDLYLAGELLWREDTEVACSVKEHARIVQYMREPGEH